MHWSKFVHIIKLENTEYLFHAVNKTLFMLTEYDYQQREVDKLPRIASFNNCDLSVLVKNEFLLKSDENTNLLERNNSTTMSLENLRILITNNCNLNCSYCQIERNLSNQGIKNMSQKTAKSVIDWFLKNYNMREQPSITITGGEPLINIESTKTIIEYARKMIPCARLTLFTNGILIESNIAKFLKEQNVFVIISIDGPEEIHNKERKSFDASNSLEKTLRGYENLLNANVKYGISAVMPDDYNDFIKMITFFCSLKPSSVGINYKHQLLNSYFNVDFKEHGRRIIQALDLFNKHSIYFENFERYKKSFISNELRTRECQSCGRGITIDARGYVGTCKSLLVSDVVLCDLKNFNYSKSEMISSWASRTPLADNDCQKCYAISICGGGCAYDSYVLCEGNYRLNDKRICPFMKTIMKRLLLDTIKNHKGSRKILRASKEYLFDSMIQSVGH